MNKSTITKHLFLTATLVLASSSGAIFAADKAAAQTDFTIVSAEETAAIQNKLGSLQSAEKEAYRQQQYELFVQRAKAAGYVMPTQLPAQSESKMPVKAVPTKPATTVAKPVAVHPSSQQMKQAHEAKMAQHQAAIKQAKEQQAIEQKKRIEQQKQAMEANRKEMDQRHKEMLADIEKSFCKLFLALWLISIV